MKRSILLIGLMTTMIIPQHTFAQINVEFFINAECVEDTMLPPNGVIDQPGDYLRLTARAAYVHNYCDSVDVGLDTYPDLGIVDPESYPAFIMNCPSGLTTTLYEMYKVVQHGQGLAGPSIDSCLVTAVLEFHPTGVDVSAGTPLSFSITWFGYANAPPPGYQTTMCAEAGYQILAPCAIGERTDLFMAGTTYFELQHNSTAGRMIGVDDSGHVHMVWTKGLDVANASRHVYYNIFDSNTNQMVFSGGQQVDGSARAGFATLAVIKQGTPYGFAFPAFHGDIPGHAGVHSMAAIDFLGGDGAFTSFGVSPLYDGPTAREIIWPKIAIGRDSVLHMVSTEGTANLSNPFFYSRGTAVYDQGFGEQIDWQTVDNVNGNPVQFKFVDSTTTLSANIAASPVSGRVVMTWLHPLVNNFETTQLANDVYIQISEDNGLNWGVPVNLTEFCTPDFACMSGNWQECNRDTMRAYPDNTLLIDDDDNIHIAFTVLGYHFWGDSTNPGDYPGQVGPFSWVYTSGVWSWNSATNDLAPVALAFSETTVPGGWHNPGAWHRPVCKPSLAIDNATGDLYCSYWRAMPDQWNIPQYPMGDIYISRSTDSGVSWSEGKNVTQTDGGQNTFAPGSLSERDATLSERVTEWQGNRYLHLFYELDHDAGTAIQGEGSVTLNEMYYQRIPVDSIPETPTVPWVSLHVASAAGACCYTNELNEIVCEQLLICECDALGGTFHGVGSSDCEPANDHCPGTTIERLPFTASGNNCCASLDWEDCGISAKDIFFNYTPCHTSTARISTCDSPESWDTYISVYRAGANGSCTDSFRVGCLDNGCVNPLHIDQLFTFQADSTYFLVLSGFFPEDCGSYVLNITDETNYTQPDSIRYDNEEIVSVNVDSLWASVRFTAPADFELHSAYFKTAFGDDSGAPCSFFVYLAPPTPAGVVAQSCASVPYSSGWSDPKWVNTLFSTPVSISEGTDFWVVAGPTKSGLPGQNGWKALNAMSNSGRSEFSNNGQYGSYTLSGSDFMLRVGGVLSLGAPDSLVIRPADNGTDVELNWSPAYGAVEYDVYRSESEDIQPLPGNLLGTTLATSFVDFGVLTNPEAQYYYIVTATGGAGWLLEQPEDSKASATAKVSAPMQIKQR